MNRNQKSILLIGAVTLIAADMPPAAPATGPSSSSATTPVIAPAPIAVPDREPRHPVSSVDVRTVTVANRAATMAPIPSGFVAAMQIYPFSDGVVYRAYAAPGQVTDIMLQPGEVLGAVASGDTARWVIGDTSSGTGDAKRSHILVKPFSAGLVTNLVVTTDRRTYHIALSSTPATAMSALSWTYPQDQLLAIQRAAKDAEAAAPVASGVDLTALHFNYAISGDNPDWRPLRAFDDGRQTFIEFPAALGQGEAPPLFLVGPKGEAELVNFRQRGHFYVVDRLFDAAELRLGLKHQDVVRVTRTAVQRRG
ncbi:P-type conjugative transfer protein TrbG [Sphingomonas sp. MAHUQ-71]|uniref:P-type conjugative transfer protein TrbG n=2 Tax=Sphingomonas oryzagri TaxID=3042314 RepID=A0ABT6N033_9SPHN|nr:P-type conjugative transfer protein TrbG [Sphingomonas oryzagri]MDH7638089.1 P-type conjugative transfer protein TrbG [Sphingomonas oryzagri]